MVKLKEKKRLREIVKGLKKILVHKGNDVFLFYQLTKTFVKIEEFCKELKSLLKSLLLKIIFNLGDIFATVELCHMLPKYST